MSGISAMSSATSALTAFGDAMNVHAHNVANINTDAFQPQVASYSTGPGGQGVQLHVSTPEREEMVNSAVNAANGGYNGNLFTLSREAGASDAINAAGPSVSGMLSHSDTELSVELTQMITTQYAHAANANTVRTADAMMGTLLDMKL